MTLSFNKLNEIAELYESIAASEQEQLNEGSADAGVETRKAIGSATNIVKNQAVKGLKSAGDLTGAYYQGFAGQKTTSKDPIARASNAVTRAVSSPVRDAGNFVKGLVTGQGDKAEPAKYKSSSDNKMYANYNDAKAARDSRLKDLAAKQQASRGTGTGSNGAGSNGAGGNGSGGNTRPPVNPKVAPTKPAGPAKPAVGTTAGGTKFERRAATGAELAAARAARDAAKASGNTKGAEEAAVKAGVNASKPSAFAPKTTAVASSTTDKGVVPASNAIAAAPKPKPMVPTRMPLAQSFEYDAYDLVLEYLLSQGHAETVAEAQYLMTEMDAEMIGDIVEARMDPRGRPASGPMNVYANPKKPSKEHSDAVKAYDEKQKKKTPEQRKKELDDYRERQMNNK